MFSKVAYLITATPELASKLAEHSEELSEFLSESRLIIRNQEPFPSGSQSQVEWNNDRTADVKRLFWRHVLRDHSDPNDPSVTAALLRDPTLVDEEQFDRWWIIERIEEIHTFEEINSRLDA